MTYLRVNDSVIERYDNLMEIMISIMAIISLGSILFYGTLFLYNMRMA